MQTLPTPLSVIGSPVASRPSPRSYAAPVSTRRFTNRDFVIILDCRADAVVVQPWGTRFPLAGLPDKPGAEVPLVRSVQQRIAQRQASVRPGEPPYRPMIRFRVQPEGLRAYYQAYPLVASLGLPMVREGVEEPKQGR